LLRSRSAPQGPSLLLLPPIFHRLYSDLGTTLQQHIDLIKCEPNYVLHFHDGEKVVLSTDRVKLRSEVERFEGPEGGDGLEGFLAYVPTLILSFGG
jgi:phytoene desaturase (3,4-didehydrolycopene-forming)